MAQEFAKAFYNSTAWKRCRAGFINSKFGLCQKCKQPGYIVHHRKEITPDNVNDQTITLSWDNLMYLCKRCHDAIHAKEEIIRNDVMFDAQGNLIKR